MLASEGVLDVLNTDTARVVRCHLATGAALGGPDDFIVPGISGLASPRSMAFAPPADADAGGLPDAWEHTHGLSSPSQKAAKKRLQSHSPPLLSPPISYGKN